MSFWNKIQKQAAIKSVNRAARIMTRDCHAVAQWRKKCLKRDQHKCLLCDSSKSLHVHHLIRWYDAPHRRTDVNNGATLCRACHDLHHGPNGEDFPAEITQILRLRIVGYTITRQKTFLIKHYYGITLPNF